MIVIPAGLPCGSAGDSETGRNIIMKKEANGNYEIITKQQFASLCDEEDKANADFLKMRNTVEINGLQYQLWVDTRTQKTYAVRIIRTVHMGFNDSPAEKVREFSEIVEREGSCKASWGVTGRTCHMMLGFELARMLPQYRFEIGDQYECTAYRKE